MSKGAMAKSISCLAELNDWSAEEVRRIAINIDRRLVQETPRRTGRAAGNWLASVDQPDSRIVGSDGDDMSTAFLQAAEQGAATIRGANVFTRIYIQNNLPYIVPLNEGWSAQAPSYYIDAIIAEETR